MKQLFSITIKTVILIFIVFCVYIGSLFFREQQVSGHLVEAAVEHLRLVPTNLVVHVDSLAFGFCHGVSLRGIRIYDTSMADPTRLLAGADLLVYNPFANRLYIKCAQYTRLPDSYYKPGNHERNAWVECVFPKIDWLHITLESPDILAVRPDRVTAVLRSTPGRIDVEDIHLVWPNSDNRRMAIEGFCRVDLDVQEVYGEVKGVATQPQIRPMLEVLDVPVSLPYFDAFTEVPEPCRAGCIWKVDLVRSDLDLLIDLHPILGKYNGVSMRRADGQIHLKNWTRADCMNYEVKVGPVDAMDVKGRNLNGTVKVRGVNNHIIVDVDAKSAQPLADVLRIAGFTGDYFTTDVIGDSEGKFQFRFPRAMTNNYEVMDGEGHYTIKNGQLMRLKGFRGLIEAMPSIAPAITWMSDTTQASCDYVIEKGVLKTDNARIEGTLFSIKMFGQFDTVKEEMDFTVRVQFTKEGSLMSKIVHPLTWPFSKLLLEFRLTGSPDNPKWDYVSVIDRVLEAVK